MLKKTITFKDYNGIERTEDFYFNLSEAEIAELQLGTAGGYKEKIEALAASPDLPLMIKIFKEIMLRAYGKKSDDGRRFIKSKEISDEFTQTPAYSALFMELAQDPEKMAAFINAIGPQIEPGDNITLPFTK